jgi:nucleotide-binding universal stress UspA family protein
MYRRVLLCYDGTLANRSALNEAVNLIVHLRAEAHVLAIAPSISLGITAATSLGASSTIQEEQYRRRVQEIAADLRARGIQALDYLVFGLAIDHIPSFAERLACDLVIVSHKSRSNMKRWWAGKENVALADRMPCSILIAIDRAD